MGYVLETVLGANILIDRGVHTMDQAEQRMTNTERLALYLIRSGEVFEENELIRKVLTDAYGPETRSVCATYAAYLRDYPLTQKICDLVIPEMPLDGNDLIEMGVEPGPGLGAMLAKAKLLFGEDVAKGAWKNTHTYVQQFHDRVRKLVNNNEELV